MIEVDPVEDQERRLARAIEQMHRELLGYHGSTVHVHIDEDAVVCVVEGAELPSHEPPVVERIHAAVRELVREVLDRRVSGRIVEMRPVPNIHIGVLRLSARE